VTTARKFLPGAINAFGSIAGARLSTLDLRPSEFLPFPPKQLRGENSAYTFPGFAR